MSRRPKVLDHQVFAASTVASESTRQTGGLALYLVLAFGLTWTLWIPAGLAARGLVDLPLPPTALIVLGGLGPLTAALTVTARSSGSAGVRRLLAGLDPRRAPRRWLAAPLLLLALDLAAVGAHLLAGGGAPAGGTVTAALVAAPFQLLLVGLVGGGIDEETGWRGYALPRLLGRHSPLVANLVLGVVWSLWHLPLWIDPDSSHAAYSFPVYLVATTSLSVLIGWMFSASGGNLFIAVLAHAVSNTGDGIRYTLLGDERAAQVPQMALTLLTVLAAVLVVVATHGRLGVTPADRFGDR